MTSWAVLIRGAADCDGGVDGEVVLTMLDGKLMSNRNRACSPGRGGPHDSCQKAARWVMMIRSVAAAHVGVLVEYVLGGQSSDVSWS